VTARDVDESGVAGLGAVRLVERVVPVQHHQPAGFGAERLEVRCGLCDGPFGVLVRGARRHDEHLARLRDGQQVRVEVAVVTELASAHQCQRAAHRGHGSGTSVLS
jgi:hypothetical protein